MELSLDSGHSGYIIQAYSEDAIIIDGLSYTKSIIVSPQQLITTWLPQRWDELNCEHFYPLFELSPETILLGTGIQQQLLSQELLKTALKKGIGIEVMNTSAACRTYNILCSEGRKVVAGLLIH